MQFTVPDYYKQFTCTAGQCPATCCAGWQIQIDPASLKKYRKAKGPLKNRLRNEIDWDEKCFRRYGGRCAFLNDDNLCDPAVQKHSAGHAGPIPATSRNLRVCVRSPCPSPVRPPQRSSWEGLNRSGSFMQRIRIQENRSRMRMMILITSFLQSLRTPGKSCSRSCRTARIL